MKRRRQRTALAASAIPIYNAARVLFYTLSPDIPSFHLSASIRTKTASLACIIHTTGSAPFFLRTHTSRLFETKQRKLTSTAYPRGASALRTCCSGGGGRKSPLFGGRGLPCPSGGSPCGEPGEGGGAWSRACGGRRRPRAAPQPPDRGSLPGGGVPLPAPAQASLADLQRASVLGPAFCLQSPSSSSKGQARSGLEQAGRPSARPPGPRRASPRGDEPKSRWPDPAACSAGAPGGADRDARSRAPEGRSRPPAPPSARPRPQAFPIPCSSRGSIVAADFPRQLQLPNSSEKN